MDLLKETAAAKAPILVLANTNCWNAYNAWGAVHSDVRLSRFVKNAVSEAISR